MSGGFVPKYLTVSELICSICMLRLSVGVTRVVTHP